MAAAARRAAAGQRVRGARDWQAIDFISDLHLSEALPRTFEAWAAHLRHTPADAVFILGDLFEVWVGDDAAHAALRAPLRRGAARCGRRSRSVAFMVGNRDFLLGAGHAARHRRDAACPTRRCCDAWHQRVLLTPWRRAVPGRPAYQAFRA